MKSLLLTILLVVGLAPVMFAQESTSKVIPAGSKVFIAPMDDGFHEYLKAAIQAKKVPVVVVDDKASADFEISGHSETQKAGTAKKVIMWDWRSNEQASIQVANLKTSEIAFAYSVNKVSSAHGKKSSAEACAKHLKEKIEGKK
jgi:hypothetical protein